MAASRSKLAARWCERWTCASRSLDCFCVRRKDFGFPQKLVFVLHRFVVAVVRLFAGLAILPFAGLSLFLANCTLFCVQFALTALISDVLRLMSIKKPRAFEASENYKK